MEGSGEGRDDYVIQGERRNKKKTEREVSMEETKLTLTTNGLTPKEARRWT